MNVPLLQINNDICLRDEFHKMWHTKRQDTLKSEMWANNLQHNKKRKSLTYFKYVPRMLAESAIEQK